MPTKKQRKLLADNMRQFRAEKKLTQSKLAVLTGLSLPTIIKAENEKEISAISMIRIKMVIEA